MKSEIEILANQKEITLKLIQEELRNRRFFQILKQANIDDNWYRADLSSLIMQNTGLNIELEEEFEFYDKTMIKYSESFEPDNESVIIRC